MGLRVGNCPAASAITKPGGPVLVVTAGALVTINLHNSLTAATSLTIQGQSIPTDTTGAAALTGTRTYTFTATNPGTYLYEAGMLPTVGGTQYQVAMGLYGALVVRPDGSPLQAYNSASTTFNDEAVLVLGEIDTALNGRSDANKKTFDMRNFKPRYFTINGEAYPATELTDPINTAAGNKVLLRYVNAGISYHSMALLGGSQSIIAYDGHPLGYTTGNPGVGYPHSVAAETFGPGQTTDALVTIPASTPANTKLAVYDANLLLKNSKSTVRFGGMMTFLNVGTGTIGDTTGPLITGVTASNSNPSNGSGTFDLTATASDPANVAVAEYRIGTSGPGTAFTFTPGSPVTLNATIAAPAVAGSYAVQVRAQDGLGNWSGWSGTTLVIDTTAPSISNFTLTPNPWNGSGNVALHAQATDTTTAVASADYNIDGGPDWEPFTVTPAGTVSLDAVITGLSAGDHTINVRALDKAGNVGTSSKTLVLDLTPPLLSSASWAWLNQSPPPIRLTATFSDSTTGGAFIGAVEGRIDGGTAFPFFPSAGTWNSSVTATGTADISAAQISLLSSGPHTFSVRGQDAAGNWSGWTDISPPLVADATAPTISAASASPTPTGGRTTQLRATATDTGGSLLNRAEWFTGTDPGLGNASIMTIVAQTGANNVTATIDVTAWAEGSYTLSVRVRDSAGNWSAIRNTTLVVTHPFYFSTVGNTNPPGLGGTADDADILRWSGTGFSRFWDARSNVANFVPTNANVDGLQVITASPLVFCVSFTGTVNLTGPGTTLGNVQDEDIACHTTAGWSMKFDGSVRGLTSGTFDIDEFHILNYGTGTEKIYFTLDSNNNPTRRDRGR